MGIPNGLTRSEYFELVRGNPKPRYRFEFLNPDESVKSIVEDDLIADVGNIGNNFNGEVGARRICSVELINTDGLYTPNPNGGDIWISNKFRLSLGLEDDEGNVYWSPNGVYIMSQPNTSNSGASKTLKISGKDKWANLNKENGGEVTETYELPIGSNVRSAIQGILNIDKGNGEVIDSIPIVFDSSLETAITSYTIREEQGGNYASLIEEICENIAAYCFYDEYGRLNIQSGTRDLGDNEKGSIFNFDDGEAEMLENNINFDFNSVINVIRVVGMNINGNIATGIAENNNPTSPTRISLIGRKTSVVKVDTIDTDAKALDYANLLLKIYSILNITYNFNVTFMTHLDVNSVITITSKFYGFERERFLIQSINAPLSTGSKIPIKATNVDALPFSNGG